MAVFNVAPYIRAAVDSVLSQTFPAWELIVVDDASTDATLSILQEYRDHRIRIVPAPHGGQIAAATTGVALASGEYLAFLDGDDIWTPDKLQRHIDYLDRNPEVDLTFSLSAIIDESGNPTLRRSPFCGGVVRFETLLRQNLAGNGSALVFRRQAFLRAGGYDPSLAFYYDRDVWLRMCLLRPGNVHAIPEYLTLYRRRRGQISRQIVPMEKAADQLIQKFRALAPEAVGAAEKEMRSNMNRFWAFIRWEEEDFRGAAAYMKRAFLYAPLFFLRDRRNLALSLAITAGRFLPLTWYRRLAQKI